MPNKDVIQNRIESIYNEDGLSTNVSDKLNEEIRIAVGPILTKYTKMGYSFREITHAAMMSIYEFELDSVIDKITKTAANRIKK